MSALSCDAVRERIRDTINGKHPITVAPESFDDWDGMFAGDVEFDFGDMRVVIFNDCDSLDYVDSAKLGDASYDYEGDDNPSFGYMVDGDPASGFISDKLLPLLKSARKVHP